MSANVQALASADLKLSNAFNDLSDKQVQALDSADRSSATPMQHNATKMQPNATVCNLPATSQPPLASSLNHDQISTYIFPASAGCNICEITTPPASPAADLNHGSVNSYDPAVPSPTPATRCTDHPLLQLTPIQRQALDLLHAGHSVPATARALNIHRVTVYRWKTYHPRFIAELAHRAALSQTETTFKAQRALDVAVSLLLKRLSSDPDDAQAIALRLIASPRLARLATASTSVSLRQTLSHFQQLRTIDAPSDAPADPLLLSDLAAELSAPIPTDSPDFASPANRDPRPTKPEPKSARPSPWARPPEPTKKERYADHPIRPDLLATFQHYGCTPESVDTAARRPDLDPFDIHCLAFAIGARPQRTSVLAECYNDKHSPSGVDAPLNPSIIADMIAAGLIKHLAGHDLAGYTASADPDTKTLTLTHPTRPTITIPHAHLWRDAVMTAGAQQRCIALVEHGAGHLYDEPPLAGSGGHIAQNRFFIEGETHDDVGTSGDSVLRFRDLDRHVRLPGGVHPGRQTNHPSQAGRAGNARDQQVHGIRRTEDQVPTLLLLRREVPNL